MRKRNQDKKPQSERHHRDRKVTREEADKEEKGREMGRRQTEINQMKEERKNTDGEM